MSAVPHRAPAERFALIIDLLRRAVAARNIEGGFARPLIALVWGHLGRLGIRFARLAARIAAGRAAIRRRATPRPAAAASARPKPPLRLPQGVGWLRRLGPEVRAGASQLQHLLTDPEMLALIEAAPQMGRILRPLCHMLGVTLPPALVLPPRPAAPASPPRRATVRPSAAAPPAAAPGRRRRTSPPLLRPPPCGPPPLPA